MVIHCEKQHQDVCVWSAYISHISLVDVCQNAKNVYRLPTYPIQLKGRYNKQQNILLTFVSI